MSLTALLAGVSLAALLGGWGLLHYLRKETLARGKAEANEEVSRDTAIETKRQADVLVERLTPADVVASLRSSARAKRSRDAKRKR